MSCTCPNDAGCEGICEACANVVAYGLRSASLVDEYRPDRIMGLMDAQAEIAWDLGVSLPEGHPFAPIVDDRLAA